MFRLSLLSGIPYNIIVIDIPQRFQAVYGTSPFGAGLRLIPFNFSIALSSVLINLIAGKTRIPPVYLLLVGSIIQLVGLALFSTLSDGLTIPTVIYGWEVISGCGIGIVMGMLLVLPPHLVEPRDLGTFPRLCIGPTTCIRGCQANVMISHFKWSSAPISCVWWCFRLGYCLECHEQPSHFEP